MLIAALALFLLAIILIFISGRQRRAAGLPGGRIVYTDTRGWGKVERPLYDQDLGLTGKPDYLVEQDGRLIPIEVKTGRTPEAPYDSHIFQLAAYCLLTQSSTGRRPPYGLLKYANQTFSVDYTSELENALLDVVFEMQNRNPRQPLPRSHGSARRCARCGYRQACDQRLEGR